METKAHQVFKSLKNTGFCQSYDYESDSYLLQNKSVRSFVWGEEAGGESSYEYNKWGHKKIVYIFEDGSKIEDCKGRFTLRKK